MITCLLFAIIHEMLAQQSHNILRSGFRSEVRVCATHNITQIQSTVRQQRANSYFTAVNMEFDI